MDLTHELDPENVDSHIGIVQSISHMLLYIGIKPAGRPRHRQRAPLRLDGGQRPGQLSHRLQSTNWSETSARSTAQPEDLSNPSVGAEQCQ